MKSLKKEGTINLKDKDILKKTYHIYYRRKNSKYIKRNTFENLLSGKYLRGEQIWKNPPTKQNTLKIGRLLGKGGYGEVYEIWKVSEPNKKYALKIPGEPLEITKGYILNEIQKLEILNRPGNIHIPKIKSGFFYLKREKIPYYITNIFKPIEEIFPEFMEELPIDPVITLENFYHIAQGLKYITSHHIVHNDLKPENIMFFNKVPIITDYGTARSYSEINEIEIERLQGRLHGTPTWLPPELISIYTDKKGEKNIFFNLGKVGQKTDVWGLGLILMRYLTGKSLFHDVPLNYNMPDIFFIIYYQFNNANILKRYRYYSYRLLQKYYGSQKKNINIPKIRELLVRGENDFNKKKECKKRFVDSNINSSRIFLAKFICKKMQFMKRDRSDLEIQEYFLDVLFDIFDICTASLEKRIKIYRLVEILETIFPGLKCP